MTPFKFILTATGLFRAGEQRRAPRCDGLAKQHGARLHIVHIVGPASRGRFREWFSPAIDLDRKLAEARDTLHRLAADLTIRYDVTPALEVRTGDVLEELQRASERADLLVMGQRRRSPLAEMVLGSTVRRLVESSGLPVPVVKQMPRSGYRRALVPIDFTPASEAAASTAAALASDIEVRVFHAFDSTGEAVMRGADVSESVILRKSSAGRGCLVGAHAPQHDPARVGRPQGELCPRSRVAGEGDPATGAKPECRMCWWRQSSGNVELPQPCPAASTACWRAHAATC